MAEEKGTVLHLTEKVNFVDDNDVFVGYDMGQHCCEDAGWFFADKITKTVPKKEGRQNGDGLYNYSFDKKFFKEVDCIGEDEGSFGKRMVIFRVVDGDKEKFLHLFNVHIGYHSFNVYNGYHNHGFEVKHGGETVREGYL